MSTPMTPSPTRGITTQLTICIAAAVITVTAGTLPAQAYPVGPVAPTPPPSAPPAPSLNPRDPDLQLPAHHRLARPKVLDLDQRRLGLTQVITTGTASPSPQPRPFPAHQPASRPQPGHTGHNDAAPGTSGTFAPASPQPSAAAPPTGTATPQPTAEGRHGPQLRTMIGLLALLAAAVTGALAVRILLRRRRTPGSTATAPQARSGAHLPTAPDGLARLDTALRTLTHRLTSDGEQDLPQLKAARIGAHHLTVLPENQAQRPLEPFHAGPDGWWQLPSDADLLDEETARTVPAPYPALATIGTTPAEGQDALLLLNFAHPPALLLDGDLPHVREVLTALVLELITSPWAADTDIITVGFGEDLPHLTPAPRTTHLPQATDAVSEISARLLEASQLPRPGRRPHLLLSALPLKDDLVAHIADLADKAAPLPLTLIAPGHAAALHFPQALVLNASLDEPQPLDHLNATVTVQRLTDHAYQHLTKTLKPAVRPAQPNESQTQDGPHARTPAPAPARPAPQQRIISTGRKIVTGEVPGPATTGHRANDSDEIFPALRAATPQTTSPLSTAANLSDGEAVTPAASADSKAARCPTTALLRTGRGGPTGDTAAAGSAHPEQNTSDRTTDQEQGPEVRVLGPVDVTGVRPSGHGPRTAQLAALLYFKGGRSADELCTSMDPDSPWSTSTLNARLQGLRRSLGNDPDGNPYVPRRSHGEDPYRLSPRVRCDWTRFLHLVEHALPLGTAGLTDLEKALTLVRGKPFGGKPLSWAEPLAQEMTTRIIDVAHTVATHRIPAGPHQNLNTARQAVATALEVDETAELIYRDWLRLEAAAGNRPGLHTALSRLQHVHHTLGVPPENETEQLIDQLLANSSIPPAPQR
ncbi:hypothetical protein ACIF8T_35485 [Streptomyces sp. NPDC085946]|uniref:hypothetical protein n=1 Tax=Streptomyces sp. NPDC085946 TaxID=3365744 RepID=UPI0037CD6225